MLHRCKWVLYGLSLLLSLAVLIGPAPQAQATNLIANWKFSEAAHSTWFADSVGTNTASFVGTDSLTTITGPYGSSGPTGLYFNGLAGTGNYVNVPYNASFGGASYMTLSSWVYLPSNWSTSFDPQSEVFSLIGGTTATNVFQLGFGQAPFKGRLYSYFNDGTTSPPTAMDSNFTSGGQYAAGQWQLWTTVYDGGSPNTALDFSYLYINGVMRSWGMLGAPTSNHTYSLVAAPTAGTMKIGGGAGQVPTRDNEFLGGLSDIGMWRTNLTGPFGTKPTDLGTNGLPYNDGHGPVLGTAAGETLAMYQTPTSGYVPLQQYGVKAMDQLFSLYDSASSSTTTVTTGNGTLTWQYVSSGLGNSSNSGYAGYIPATGQYFVQLDTNGGGVETVVVPEPSTLALFAAGAMGLLAYAWRKRK